MEWNDSWLEIREFLKKKGTLGMYKYVLRRQSDLKTSAG